MRLAFLSIFLAIPLMAEEVAKPQRETMESDSAAVEAPAQPQAEAAPATEAAQPEPFAAPAAMPVKKDAQSTLLRNSVFDRLTLGGTMQVKGVYHDISAAKDSDKELGASLSKFRLDLEGAYNEHFGILGQFLLEANGKNLGIEQTYAYYQQGHFQLRAGKIKKPFSMEALQSSTGLYTVERGKLYGTFLNDTTGYSLYDVGLTLKGGFTDEGTEVTYEAGVFNGKQSADGKGYAGAQYENKDNGFKAKDFAGRVTLKGFGGLETELAFSTKGADKRVGTDELSPKFDAAYEAGLAYERAGVRFQGEIAWGSNHHSVDSFIVDGASEFLAFYSMLVWRHNYSGGRASETLLKMEGLDPDMTIGSGGGRPNDGRFRYTLGVNYFFTPKISLLADYAILHPITKVKADNHLTHDFDLLWRLNF